VVKADAQTIAEAVAGHLVAATTRLVTEMVARLEHGSSDTMRQLEERRARLEDEIADRAVELRELRRQIDTEREKSRSRLGILEGLDGLRRQIQAASEGPAQAQSAPPQAPPERLAAEVISDAHRQAEELLAEARLRAAELEREAAAQQSAVLAESEKIESQLRGLDARISQLLRQAPETARPAQEQRGFEPPGGPVEPETKSAEPPAPGRGTLVFHEVPTFKAALDLERGLRAMPLIREVKATDFDERRLTFLVTHDMGETFPRPILALDQFRLEIIRAEPERAELELRS